MLEIWFHFRLKNLSFLVRFVSYMSITPNVAWSIRMQW